MMNPAKPPKRIYLQVYGADEPKCGEVEVGEVDGVTWYADRIWESDAEYRLVPKKKKPKLRSRRTK